MKTRQPFPTVVNARFGEVFLGLAGGCFKLMALAASVGHAEPTSPVEPLPKTEAIYAIFPNVDRSIFQIQPGAPAAGPSPVDPFQNQPGAPEPSSENSIWAAPIPFSRWKEDPSLFGLARLLDVFPMLKKHGIPQEPTNAVALWNETDQTLYVRASPESVDVIDTLINSVLCGGVANQLRVAFHVVEMASSSDRKTLLETVPLLIAGKAMPAETGTLVAQVDLIGRSSAKLSSKTRRPAASEPATEKPSGPKPNDQPRRGDFLLECEPTLGPDSRTCDLNAQFSVSIPQSDKGPAAQWEQLISTTTVTGSRIDGIFLSPEAPNRRFFWCLSLDIVFPSTSACGRPGTDYQPSPTEKKWLAQKK